MKINRDADRFIKPLVALGAGVAVFGLVVLFAVLAAGVDDDTRRCPVTRTTAGDVVPAGPRPCVLYGNGPSSGAVLPAADGSSSTGSSTKAPATPKAKTPAAKAPAVKAPAPAPKAAAPARKK
ncbi:hypothetical protein [Streptomyces sp. NBC_00620]|uniref:hypothetical protein n=1 Tax=Streptomyces sp. NBC_00620 TaxID=2903666 RepID=UPI002255941B|nr:hypothetical protein [Streptomyces sp. NBC_00620]MCX4976490.1 hypothetical protein [Streptomyces sp. NBC_00620]